jgi:hypothetical protein
MHKRAFRRLPTIKHNVMSYLRDRAGDKRIHGQFREDRVECDLFLYSEPWDRPSFKILSSPEKDSLSRH